MGFFLNKRLSNSAMVYHLKKTWKLKGSIQVKSDGFLFLFPLSSVEDRCRILQGDPIIMQNKLFISSLGTLLLVTFVVVCGQSLYGFNFIIYLCMLIHI